MLLGEMNAAAELDFDVGHMGSDLLIIITAAFTAKLFTEYSTIALKTSLITAPIKLFYSLACISKSLLRRTSGERRS